MQENEEEKESILSDDEMCDIGDEGDGSSYQQKTSLNDLDLGSAEPTDSFLIEEIPDEKLKLNNDP